MAQWECDSNYDYDCSSRFETATELFVRVGFSRNKLMILGCDFHVTSAGGGHTRPTRCQTRSITITDNFKIVALIKNSKSHFNLAAVIIERHDALPTALLFKLNFVTNTVAFIIQTCFPPRPYLSLSHWYSWKVTAHSYTHS